MGSTNYEEIEELYKQLFKIMKKTKLSKNQLAKGINMSYAGFLNSLNNRKLSMEKWVEISKFTNLPISFQLETGRKVKQPEVEENIEESPVNIESNDKTQVELLQKHIQLLESRLEDKDVIISLLKG